VCVKADFEILHGLFSLFVVLAGYEKNQRLQALSGLGGGAEVSDFNYGL
jgi:hypothetical protein